MSNVKYKVISTRHHNLELGTIVWESEYQDRITVKDHLLYTDGFNKQWLSVDQVEEIKMSELFGKKYRVTPETSELLQKAVFEAGGVGWILCRDGSQTVLHTDKPYLFVRESGLLTNASDEGYFKRKEFPEGILEVVKSIKLKEVVAKPTKEEVEYQELMASIAEMTAKAEKLKPKS